MSSIPDCASISAVHKDTAKTKLLQMAYRSKAYEHYLIESKSVSDELAKIKSAIEKHPAHLPSYEWTKLCPSDRTLYTRETKRLAYARTDMENRLSSFKMNLIDVDVSRYGTTFTTSDAIIAEYKKAHDMFHEYIAICEKLKTKMIWTSEFDERFVRFEGGHDICPIIFSREFIDLLCANGFHVKYTKISHTQTISHGDSFRLRECSEIYAITHKLVVSCCGGLEIDEKTDDELTIHNVPK
jgi:hypothetical protein